MQEDIQRNEEAVKAVVVASIQNDEKEETTLSVLVFKNSRHSSNV